MNNKKIFEKIITEKRAKSSNERPKYGLRKLTVGVVSCLLGYMMFMTPNVTLAEKVDATQAVEATVESKEVNNVEKETDQPKEEALEIAETEKAVSHVAAYSSNAEETEAKEEFKLTDEQVAKLEKANFTQAEIEKIEAEVKSKKEADESFDIESFLNEKIADKKIADEKDQKAKEDANALEVSKDGADNKEPQKADGIATRSTDIDEVEKNATYVPGVEGQKQSYSGTAYLYKGGRLDQPSNAETLKGVNVYLQWVDYDGYVSKVYKTTSRPDGTFTFDLSMPETDKYGNQPISN